MTANIMLSRFDHIHHTQLVFRGLLDSMARPGKVNSISSACAALTVPQGWSRGLAAVALTLLDNEVTFAACRGPDGRPDEAASAHIERETFGRRTGINEAQFVIVNGTLTGDAAGILIGQLSRGTLQYPEDGATLLLDVRHVAQVASDGLTAGGEPIEEAGLAGRMGLRLVGPGVPRNRLIRVTGLPPAAIEARNQSCAEYPMGIDVFLVTDGGTLVALPRTTGISAEGES